MASGLIEMFNDVQLPRKDLLQYWVRAFTPLSLQYVVLLPEPCPPWMKLQTLEVKR